MTAYATVVLAVFAIIATIYAYKGFKEQSKAVEIQNKSFKEQSRAVDLQYNYYKNTARPFIIVDSVVVPLKEDNSLVNLKGVIKNHGSLPAKNVKWFWYLYPEQNKERLKLNIPFTVIDSKSLELIDSKSETYKAIFPNEIGERFFFKDSKCGMDTLVL